MCDGSRSLPVERPRRRAFTLVELLVVIGIVSVLISMLMPALARARQSAKQVQCAAQLRQLGQALMTYASNHTGHYPGWSGWHVYGNPETGDDERGLAWAEKLERYFAKVDSGVYHCPEFPPDTPMNYYLSCRWLNLSGQPCLQVSDIKRSSEFVLSGDCTQPFLYPPPFGDAPHVAQDCDKDDATQPGTLYFGQSQGQNMHRAGNNSLFADGHVAPFKEFDPQRMTHHPRKMQSWHEVTAD